MSANIHEITTINIIAAIVLHIIPARAYLSCIFFFLAFRPNISPKRINGMSNKLAQINTNDKIPNASDAMATPDDSSCC